MSQICLRGVSRKYILGGHEVMALKPLDLDIEAGEMVLFVGPSGSGKTTLLNLMAGIDSPDTGTIMVDGQDIARLSNSKLLEYRRKKVGLVFQFHHLIPNLTAWENVELVAEMVSGGGDIKGCLEAVGLGERAGHFPHQLSGGEQQRVAIARAMVKDPPILLGDEPTGNLDARTGKQVLSLFTQANQRGKTVLMVTHNLDYTPVASRVIRMADGGIVKDERNENPLPVDQLR
ncbi:MAG: ABC transporter ATP-binding protein [Vulcanimicrobiota bacterium]